MDLVTHTAAGGIFYLLFASNKYLKTEKKKLLLISTFAAVFPDIDIIFKIFGEIFFYKMHRGITHSIFFNIFLLTGVYYYLRKKSCEKINIYFSLISLNIVFHIFLDITTSYGTMIFEPFSDYRASIDLFFIIDILILAAFIIPCIIHFIFRKLFFSKCLAIAAFIFFFSYCFYSYIQSVKMRKEIMFITENTGVSFVKVLPGPLIANYKNIILEDAFCYHYGPYATDGFITTQFQKFDKKIIKNITGFSKLLNSSILDFYLSFTRFPVYTIEDNIKTTVLEIFDIRYYFDIYGERLKKNDFIKIASRLFSNKPVFTFKIILDKKQNELTYSFHKTKGKI